MSFTPGPKSLTTNLCNIYPDLRGLPSPQDLHPSKVTTGHWDYCLPWNKLPGFLVPVLEGLGYSQDYGPANGPMVRKSMVYRNVIAFNQAPQFVVRSRKFEATGDAFRLLKNLYSGLSSSHREGAG